MGSKSSVDKGYQEGGRRLAHRNSSYGAPIKFLTVLLVCGHCFQNWRCLCFVIMFAGLHRLHGRTLGVQYMQLDVWRSIWTC